MYLKTVLGMMARAPVAFFRTGLLALKHRVPGMKALLLACAYFAESMVLAAELRRRGITHVHNHFANPSATVSMLATRYLGITWSLTLHAHSETDYPAGNLLGAKLELCDFAACVSNFGRAQAYRQVGPEHWHKLFIARCGIDLTALPEVPERKPHDAMKRVICVARLAPEKGHSGLLKAFTQISENNVSELVLVGDGPERARLEREVQALGLSDLVTFKGALPENETLKEISSSDVLVLASFMEGIPVALMEAMALGKAVIAPNLAGIPDLIEHGYNGELFTPADWDSLTAALNKTLGLPFIRTRYGTSGRKTIEYAYDIRVAIEPLIQRFETLTDRETVNTSETTPYKAAETA
jgi:glycosyltransferase involved in cell wall biosynthesis